MGRSSHLPKLILLGPLLIACNLLATISGVGAGTSTGTPEGATAPCELVASQEFTIYERPNTSSGVFSSEQAGFRARVSAMAAGGWVGFQPGGAQAANVGVFRFRWVAGTDVSLEGDCRHVPVMGWVPAPGICYEQPQEDAPVYASPEAGSSVIATLKYGDFAAITGKGPSGWMEIDLGDGNTGSKAKGWIEDAALNTNGACYNLPATKP